jgi:3-isopropylmalate dehydrogenase
VNRIVLLPGDGIGPEVTREAQRVLELVSERHNLKLNFEKALYAAAPPE